MIDRKLFDETFSEFDRETVIEILDIFISEFEGRFEKLHRNVEMHNFDELRLNAHSLKGVVSNFMDPACTGLAIEFDRMARNQMEAGLDSALVTLEESARHLLAEIKSIRESLIS
jgi:HPt (histidine-containing phosphotransfer) domain-containing protein